MSKLPKSNNRLAKISALFLSLCLTACVSQTASEPKVTLPKVMYIPIPETLLVECAQPVLQKETMEGLANYALRLKAELESCNRKILAVKAFIRKNQEAERQYDGSGDHKNSPSGRGPGGRGPGAPSGSGRGAPSPR